MSQDLNEMKRQMNKDQKCIHDRNEELAHSRRKSEQHESEVRSLRSRIEELKKQQTSTEDEVSTRYLSIQHVLRLT